MVKVKRSVTNFSNKISSTEQKLEQHNTKPQSYSPPYKAWVITGGAVGMENQCLGLAQALDIEPVIKRVSPPAPWRWLAPHGPAAPCPDIKPPWPNLLIALGRQSIPYARTMKRWSGGKTFVALLQNPHIPLRHFDFVWAPRHDGLEGDNVFSTLTHPHLLTVEKLQRETALWSEKLSFLPRPRIAVLVGGDTRAGGALNKDDMYRLCSRLRRIAQNKGAGLMITPSRRTGEWRIALLRKALRDLPFWMWSGTPPNPYAGFLGLADVVVVTGDSTNMVGEAAVTGKPVYVFHTRQASTRHTRFLEDMTQAGIVRFFGDQIEEWTYPPLNATPDIAHALRQAWGI
ncbi:MAG: mitochondrial fission ELM1 family protein [Parvularculales bacterium]